MVDVDLIVPTIQGREASLVRCLESFGNRVRPIIVYDFPSCGAGWLEGMKDSTATYIVLCCDDIEADGDTWLDAAVETIDQGMLPAPIIHRPDGSLESAGGDMSAPACLLSEIQPDWTPVSFTPLPIIGREQLDEIGVLPIHYLSDVWISHRGRQLGYETVLRHDYRLIHHHEMVGRINGDRGDRIIFEKALSG